MQTHSDFFNLEFYFVNSYKNTAWGVAHNEEQKIEGRLFGEIRNICGG